MFSHASDEWATPKWVFDRFNALYHFTLDPCATPENALCEKYYTKEQDGLKQNWMGESMLINPPYSNIGAWARKCAETFVATMKEKSVGDNSDLETVIMLLVPARTDTRWFHDVIYRSTGLTFIKGRLHFNDSKNTAPFPSIVIEFDTHPDAFKGIRTLTR